MARFLMSATLKIEPKFVDWWKDAAATDQDPDDELLQQTPPDVVAILGFDPAKEPPSPKGT